MQHYPIAIVGIILATICLAGGTAGAMPVQDSTPGGGCTLKITADPGYYAPGMSSTVGIGLTPSYGGCPATVKYSWKTTKGIFLRWSPPLYKVITLGKSVTNQGGKVYWAWRGAIPEGPLKEPLAVISLVATDDETGEKLGEKTGYVTYSDSIFHFSQG